VEGKGVSDKKERMVVIAYVIQHTFPCLWKLLMPAPSLHHQQCDSAELNKKIQEGISKGKRRNRRK